MKQNRYRVKFKYADELSRWEWRDQECEIMAYTEGEAVEKAKDWYGLGKDCDYKIVEVTQIY